MSTALPLDPYVEPSAPTSSTEVPNGAPKPPDFKGKGTLLEDANEARVCKTVEDWWKSQDPRMRPILAQWKANEYTMEGVPGVEVVKDTDTDNWFARVPIGASAVRVGISKTRELVEKTTATITTDPPVPKCQPSPDDDSDQAKAEFCTQILTGEIAESGLQLHRLLRQAGNLGGTYGSGFIVITPDVHGGGWTPLAIDAHPAATQYDEADPEAVLQPAPDLLDDPAAAALPFDPVRKFVGEVPEAEPTDDGTETAPQAAPLTDDPRQAQKQWQLRLTADLKTGRQLRMLPMTARGIHDADGVVLVQASTFGALRGMLPVIDTWSEDDQRALMTWRPVDLKTALPPGLAIAGDGQNTVSTEGDKRQGLPADDALCVTFAVYFRAHPAYPEGAYLLLGGKRILHRDTRTVWIGEGADQRPECLDLPVAQVVRRVDATGANPFGIGDAQLLAPGEDLRAQLKADSLESLWRKNHPNVFVPIGSPIDPGSLDVRDGTPIRYNSQTGAPIVYEDVPPVDPTGLEWYATEGREMDSRSGLEDAQRLNNPNITSGKQAQVVAAQSGVTLSEVKDNSDVAFIRLCRIVLQNYRAYATQPQLLRYVAEDGRYVVQEWINTDLGSTRDILIAPGTSTMLTPDAKQQLAMQDFEVAFKAGDQQGGYRRYLQATQSGLDARLGRQLDPQLQRVRRQVHAWRQGPPAGEPEPQAMPQPPQMDPATGQPIPPQPQPDARAVQLFAPLPVDAQPDVAKTRATVLGDELAREGTANQPPTWVLALAQAYEVARQAAGIQTVADMQAAQQQQAAQAAQQQQAAGQQQAQQHAQDTEAKVLQNREDNATDLERTRIQASGRGAE